MVKRSGDLVLAVWFAADFLWSVLVWGTTAYAVFWKERSGWWFLLAVILICSTTLYKVLGKRFGLAEEKEDEGD